MLSFLFGVIIGALIGTYTMAWVNSYREWEEPNYEDKE